MGSIVLTFDDGHCINSWYESTYLFEQYNASATFYISKYHSGMADQLLFLQNQGFEIAHHTTYHANALEWFDEHGLDSWLKGEIRDSLNNMKKDGLKVSSFAFPFGSYSIELSEALREDFESVRGYLTPKTKDLRLGMQNDGYFYMGVGIDSSYFEPETRIFLAMDKAKATGRDLILIGHCIVEGEPTSRWQTPTKNLIKIFEYAKEIGLQFKTMNQLNKKLRVTK
ncbi:polysaccharide deacetylase family protein [Pseudoalteromonas sp. S558]|uniref:polysaccharide deacetylase family protein n=1 Tax=Pseudoalteromonas sp. S558 TaxID=2066515 RepID=UPI00148760A5|nr:polysaccharide deacetylase family protein [Pseudoalteromonas sp. S558]